MHTSFNQFVEGSNNVPENHTDNPNDKYEVKPCDEEGTPFAVWEGDTRVKCFETEEAAQEYADEQNAKQDLDESSLSEGTMSDIHQLAGEVKDLAQFVKEFFKKFGDKIKKTADSTKWVETLYNDMATESVVTEKVSFAQMKKDSKTKEYKEVSNALRDDTEEVSDIWNMLDPKMFKFTESEFEDIFHEWWNTQSYDSLEDFCRNGSFEDAHSLYKHLLPYVVESAVTEAVARDTKIYCISTPAPKAMLVEELEDLFGDDYRHYVTEFKDDEGYESVLVFNLTKKDIKMIQKNIGDVLIWEYSIKKGKEIMESVVNEAKFVKDFNRDVLDAKTKDEVLKLYPNAEFFIGKSDHFFGELDDNLFFKAYYTKGQKEFEIKSIYSEKNKNYVHLYNESVVSEGYGEWNTAKNLTDIIDMSKDNKRAVFYVTDDNNSRIGTFYLKNGKFAKATSANPSYDLQNNKTKLRDRSDVIYKYKVDESVINEGKIQLKRRYTENHPAVTAGKSARVRNKVLEFIKDGRISKEAFEKFVSDLSNNSKRWTRNNAKYFSISEEGVTLSKFGKKILNNIMINEAYDGNMSDFKYEFPQKFEEATGNSQKAIKKMAKKGKGKFEVRTSTYMYEPEMKAVADAMGMELVSYEKHSNIAISVFESKINEETLENPEIWVPKGFDKAISKLPNSQITKDVVLKVAKKHKVNPEDAIRYVEYGWALDLNEQKNTNMKTQFIYESFSSFVESLDESVINEAFKSSKLRNLLTMSSAHRWGGDNKDLAKRFYQYTKIQLDQVGDEHILDMDMKAAYKASKDNDRVIFYVSDVEKESPYAKDGSFTVGKGLVGISRGKDFLGATYSSKYSRNADKTLGKGGTDIGTNKEYKGYGSSGLSSVKRVAEVSDRAYSISISALQSALGSADKRDARANAQRDAVAFKSDKDFKRDNLARYKDILANKASKLPLDKMVADAIDTLADQIKKGLADNKKGKYGDLIIGISKKGREVKFRDASNHMSNILSDYDRYVGYVAEEEKTRQQYGNSESWYAKSIKEYAKSTSDKIKQVEDMSYAW